MALNTFEWENGTLVEPAKVEIGGVSYDVTDAQYEGSTPLSASNLNLMQSTLLGNVKDDLTDDTKIPSVKAIKNTYSETETVIGTWINGKPIYRKVIDLGLLGTQTQISYGNQIDTITSFGGYLYQDNGSNLALIEYTRTASVWIAITYEITRQHTMNVLINRSNTSEWSDWKLKIVIEYTKTTD